MSSSTASPPPWIELPRDVTVNILSRLGPEDILDSAERVCTTWRNACNEPSLWRVFRLKYSDKLHTHDRVDSLCRRAVDRSQGEMIEISINRFGMDSLLRYISERSKHLKILSLEAIYHISPRGLTTAVKSLPLLEELHLFFIRFIRARDIEIIGISCPMLKSFTLKNCSPGLQNSDADNDRALSISKNMPNLRRLRLFGDLLHNEGLLAILDGCPNIESLDLRDRVFVDLECDLGRRCSGQIKELRRPCDGLDEQFYDPEVDKSVHEELLLHLGLSNFDLL